MSLRNRFGWGNSMAHCNDCSEPNRRIIEGGPGVGGPGPTRLRVETRAPGDGSWTLCMLLDKVASHETRENPMLADRGCVVDQPQHVGEAANPGDVLDVARGFAK